MVARNISSASIVKEEYARGNKPERNGERNQ